MVVVMAARAAASRREGVRAAWPALGSASFKHRRGDQRSAAPSRKSSRGGRSVNIVDAICTIMYHATHDAAPSGTWPARSFFVRRPCAYRGVRVGIAGTCS